ncbi:MAG: RpiB/LacA/LacB family sugar-phosphate isomerase [Bacilli bacterium]|nr:RpiB/LacA/LacB family sugar-phosphate isomerase [Bacilli bacterium]
MKLYISCDHRGVALKQYLLENLKGYEIIESTEHNYELDSYVDFAFELGEYVAKHSDVLGILICGNGIGMSIAANKVKGIRCARVLTSDDAFKSRNHNGANVIALGNDLYEDFSEALKVVETFVTTDEVSNPKYIDRVNKIINYELGE